MGGDGDDDWLEALGAVARERGDAAIDEDPLHPVEGAELAPGLVAARAPPEEEALERAVASARRGLASSGEAEVVSLASRRATGVLALLAAAALAVVVLMPSDARLPRYELEIERHAVSEVRGAHEVLQLRPGGDFALVARPARRVDRELVAGAILRSPSGRLPLNATVTVSGSGSIRLEARVPDDVPDAGEVVVRVGPPGALGAFDAPPPPSVRELTWPFVRFR